MARNPAKQKKKPKVAEKKSNAMKGHKKESEMREEKDKQRLKTLGFPEAFVRVLDSNLRSIYEKDKKEREVIASSGDNSEKTGVGSSDNRISEQHLQKGTIGKETNHDKRQQKKSGKKVIIQQSRKSLPAADKENVALSRSKSVFAVRSDDTLLRNKKGLKENRIGDQTPKEKLHVAAKKTLVLSRSKSVAKKSEGIARGDGARKKSDRPVIGTPPKDKTPVHGKEAEIDEGAHEDGEIISDSEVVYVPKKCFKRVMRYIPFSVIGTSNPTRAQDGTKIESVLMRDVEQLSSLQSLRTMVQHHGNMATLLELYLLHAFHFLPMGLLSLQMKIPIAQVADSLASCAKLGFPLHLTPLEIESGMIEAAYKIVEQNGGDVDTKDFLHIFQEGQADSSKLKIVLAMLQYEIGSDNPITIGRGNAKGATTSNGEDGDIRWPLRKADRVAVKAATISRQEYMGPATRISMGRARPCPLPDQELPKKRSKANV